MSNKPYDCDTQSYWCSEQEYLSPPRSFGHFLEDGSGYRITHPAPPRPWLNYFANARFGAVLSDHAMGFCWYKTPLMRITRYEHPIDYLPRQFTNGRDVTVTDMESGTRACLFRDGLNPVCTHYPGYSEITATMLDLHFRFRFFVPVTLPCEVWLVHISNPERAPRSLAIEFTQTWSFAKFGSHTAEAGIPYVSTPGEHMTVDATDHTVVCEAAAPELPWRLHGFFASPGATARSSPLMETRPDGRKFTFHHCALTHAISLEPGAETELAVFSGATEDPSEALHFKRATRADAYQEWRDVLAHWNDLVSKVNCTIPEKNLEAFLNHWFKNQLHLTFHFVRSGHWGYRDALQDAWAYAMLSPTEARDRLRFMLGGMFADGTAPRQLSKFEDGKHDFRRFMDSTTWAPRAVLGLLQETGDPQFLFESIPFLDGHASTVLDHLRRGVDSLWEKRGSHGGCLTGDGDWNDALEGISRDGDAESYWLTMALYDATVIMQEIYSWIGDHTAATLMAERAAQLTLIVNEVAWDGEWYCYGVTGSGKPIGSHRNREGRIHLNAQSWAIFTGLSDPHRTELAIAAVEKHLETPVGPALLAPPYALEADEIGRIARLEPGTFENGSVYQHAVSFYILALLRAGHHEQALDLFLRVLPTNPLNPDTRRTSEPYCTGNYYCGPGHSRFGQNFFTWFTGNAAWLLRIGFDELLGVKGGLQGLLIDPRAPLSWSNWYVTRVYRGCRYDLRFTRTDQVKDMQISVDGRPLSAPVIPPLSQPRASVEIKLPLHSTASTQTGNAP